jgi:hypothetical protein
MFLDLEWEMLRARFAFRRQEACDIGKIGAELQDAARLMRARNESQMQDSKTKTERALRSFGSLPEELVNEEI